MRGHGADTSCIGAVFPSLEEVCGVQIVRIETSVSFEEATKSKEIVVFVFLFHDIQSIFSFGPDEVVVADFFSARSERGLDSSEVARSHPRDAEVSSVGIRDVE